MWFPNTVFFLFVSFFFLWTKRHRVPPPLIRSKRFCLKTLSLILLQAVRQVVNAPSALKVPLQTGERGSQRCAVLTALPLVAAEMPTSRPHLLQPVRDRCESVPVASRASHSGPQPCKSPPLLLPLPPVWPQRSQRGERKEEVPQEGERGFACASDSSYKTGSCSMGSSVDLLGSELSVPELGCSTSTLREAIALTVSASSLSDCL